MAWILLLVAGLLEVGWSVGMKFTDGFTRLWPSVFTGAGIVASMVLLSYAARSPADRYRLRRVGRHRGGRCGGGRHDDARRAGHGGPDLLHLPAAGGGRRAQGDLGALTDVTPPLAAAPSDAAAPLPLPASRRGLPRSPSLPVGARPAAGYPPVAPPSTACRCSRSSSLWGVVRRGVVWWAPLVGAGSVAVLGVGGSPVGPGVGAPVGGVGRGVGPGRAVGRRARDVGGGRVAAGRRGRHRLRALLPVAGRSRGPDARSARPRCSRPRSGRGSRRR